MLLSLKVNLMPTSLKENGAIKSKTVESAAVEDGFKSTWRSQAEKRTHWGFSNVLPSLAQMSSKLQQRYKTKKNDCPGIVHMHVGFFMILFCSFTKFGQKHVIKSSESELWTIGEVWLAICQHHIWVWRQFANICKCSSILAVLLIALLCSCTSPLQPGQGSGLFFLVSDCLLSYFSPPQSQWHRSCPTAPYSFSCTALYTEPKAADFHLCHRRSWSDPKRVCPNGCTVSRR